MRSSPHIGCPVAERDLQPLVILGKESLAGGDALTSDRWADVERLYHDAMARPAHERAAFLAESCAGDEALRHEVDSLLAHGASPDGVLSGGAVVAAAGLVGNVEHSSLTGRRIGAYQFLAPIGAGGMGEVYRARDTRLGREVAIKILPHAFTADADRLARFEREARVLASLNHPHIAAIHGVEESDGLRALVLELVEGETLAQRIAACKTGLPVKEALDIARQIADALEAAHEKGIVHRDLKPANIKITPQGVVKVLDFGLAKLEAKSGGGAEGFSESPTIAVNDTREGLIVGTAAYMSPEQARGQVVDKRTDIWAFGCVLYEMLTRRAVFLGSTVTDTLAAILEREPDWKALPATTPTGLARLLRRSLDKDLKHRLRDIGDARLELEDAFGGAADPQQTTAPRSPRGSVPWQLAFLGSVIVLAAVGWFVFQQRQSPPADQTPNDASLERLTYDSGSTTMPALSPDGRLLAYASDRAGRGDLDIWVQQTAAGAPLQLTSDPADDDSPGFSPDGNQIVFHSDRNGGGIYVMSALGGPARLIAADGRTPRFSPNGTAVAYWTGQFRGDPTDLAAATFVLPLTGGAPRRLLSDFVVASYPLWSPDGRSLLVLGRRDFTSPKAQVLDWWWVPLDGRPPSKSGALDFLELRRATAAEQVTLGNWTSAGVMFSVGGSLWSLPISPESGQVAGSPRRLTFGTGQALGVTSSRDGQIVFAIAESERVIERVSLKASGASRAPTRLYSDNRPSVGRASETSDGSTIVFEKRFPGYTEIWQKTLRSPQEEMVLRVGNSEGLDATVSPDGTRIAYVVQTGNLADHGNGFVLERASGVPKSLCQNCEVHGFLSDNKRVLVVSDNDHVIATIDTSTGRREDLVKSAASLVSRPHASPDDRWLAFRNTNGTVGKSFLTALVPGRPREPEHWQQVQEPTTTGRPTGWSIDSRVMYLFLDSDGFRCLWGQRVDEFGRLSGIPFVVRHLHKPGGASTSYGNSITSDGLMYERSNTTANLWRMVNSRVETER
jgi:serine/threonine protein kinase